MDQITEHGVPDPARSYGSFQDGTAGEIDLWSALAARSFEPLHDPVVFEQFSIHAEFQTLVWPNGADFAPEFLHDNIRVTA